MKKTIKLTTLFIALSVFLISCNNEEDDLIDKVNYLEIINPEISTADIQKENPDNIIAFKDFDEGDLYLSNEGGEEVYISTSLNTALLYWSNFSGKVSPNKPVIVSYIYTYAEGEDEWDALSKLANNEDVKAVGFKKTVTFENNRRYEWAPREDSFEDVGIYKEKEEDEDDDDDNSEDCTDWHYYLTECLGNSGVSGDISSAGIRQKACIINETSTSITVEATIEPANGGIDSDFSYKGIDIYFRGDESSSYMTVQEFNSGGTITKTITANKDDINSYWLENWESKGSIAFVEATCVYN
ncbi:hypothetical protein SAMN04488028_103267 [Reichenbachiella agariperforans]|uniref:Uncharacterized protein n=1 Tax=Reichenbachiella agariperforans TaxID=156994 RepID=A0A1M6QCD9_REIAG|nr:hypothetical protein [Reichenbachiella agariperforans]SHK17838.1 hypothetical protein SAMN04488028_103267 [Reichenbachiella agariperforans]